MSGPDPILEAAAAAIDGSDARGCGCCAAGADDRHPDGSKCFAAYDRDASCGGVWLKGSEYTCGGRTWDRDEVLAHDVLTAVRPLIEAEVREAVARELDAKELRWRTRRDATEDLGRGTYYSGLALAYHDAARMARGGCEGTGSDA